MRIRLGIDKFRDKDLLSEDLVPSPSLGKQESAMIRQTEAEALALLKKKNSAITIGSKIMHSNQTREIKHLYSVGQNVMAQLDNGEQIMIG